MNHSENFNHYGVLIASIFPLKHISRIRPVWLTVPMQITKSEGTSCSRDRHGGAGWAFIKAYLQQLLNTMHLEEAELMSITAAVQSRSPQEEIRFL